MMQSDIVNVDGHLPEYEIVNNDYAYVRWRLHLSLNPAELMRNRSTLPAGVTALMVSNINHLEYQDSRQYHMLWRQALSNILV